MKGRQKIMLDQIKVKSWRSIQFSSLRQLCIDKNWYTLGNNEEYENLLKMTNTANVTDETLYKMATNIKNHSKTEHEITSIMFELAKISFTYFELSN